MYTHYLWALSPLLHICLLPGLFQPITNIWWYEKQHLCHRLIPHTGLQPLLKPALVYPPLVAAAWQGLPPGLLPAWAEQCLYISCVAKLQPRSCMRHMHALMHPWRQMLALPFNFKVLVFTNRTPPDIYNDDRNTRGVAIYKNMRLHVWSHAGTFTWSN